MLQPTESPLVEQAVPLQPVGPTWSRYPHCSPWRSPRWGGAGGCGLKEAAAHGEPPQEQAPGWSCSPWRGAHLEKGFLTGTVAHGGPMMGQFDPNGLYLMERTQCGAVVIFFPLFCCVERVRTCLGGGLAVSQVQSTTYVYRVSQTAGPHSCAFCLFIIIEDIVV